MHRFFITREREGQLLTLTNPEQIRQIKDILKLRPGEQIVLVPGDGTELVCEILTFGRKDIELGLVERRAVTVEPQREVVVYCAVLKRDNFEWVDQKATECGATKIVPMTTDHTVKLGLNNERLHKIMVEAAEQSGRGFVPVLGDIVSFTAAVADAQATCDALFFFDQSKTVFSAADVAKAKCVALFIGPEGGWSATEKEVAAKTMLVRSLGPRVLRAETAAIVATYTAAL